MHIQNWIVKMLSPLLISRARTINIYIIQFQTEMSLQKEKTNSKNQQWHPKLHLRYFLYLVLNYSKLKNQNPSQNKIGKFYVTMSNWLCEKKSSTQCRTHHIKCLEKYKNSIHTLLLSQIYIYYKMRHLTICHLLTQMQNYLQFLTNRKVITPLKMNEFLTTTSTFIDSQYPQLQKSYQQRQIQQEQEEKQEAIMLSEQQPQIATQRTEMKQGQQVFPQQQQAQQISNLLYIPGYVEPECFFQLKKQ